MKTKKSLVLARKAKPNLWLGGLLKKNAGHRKCAWLSKSLHEKHRFSCKCNHWV